jgi:thioredoxin-like negative regulator of GroEL
MAPVVYGLEDRYAEQIDFVYLDVDDPAVRSVAGGLEVVILPHFFLLDADGNIIDQWGGLVAETQFTTVFDAMLASQSVP